MARVNWTTQALEDLDALCLFIARDAPRYAELLAGRMFEAADVLGEFPMPDGSFQSSGEVKLEC